MGGSSSRSSTAANQLQGMIVYASKSSGEVYSVTFKLQWAAGLAPTPLPDGKVVLNIAKQLQSMAVQQQGSRLGTAAAAGCSDGPRTGNAAAAAPTAVGGTNSRSQRPPGRAASGYLAKVLRTLSVAAAPAAALGSSARCAHTASALAGAGGPSQAAAAAAAAAAGQRGVRGHTSQSGPRSSLGAWQLPSVVQVVTPGPEQLLARSVSESVRSERLRGLRLQRAAAAATKGDPR
jgi:hypothetical protein